MNYATNIIEEEEVCELEEPDLGVCPLCKYQDDNIIRSMTDVERNLTGNIEKDEIYNVLVSMYNKHTAPLLVRKETDEVDTRVIGTIHKACSESYRRWLMTFNTASDFSLVQEEHWCEKSSDRECDFEPPSCERVYQIK